MSKKTLNIVESAYRAVMEEQDDTILWLLAAMQGAGAEHTVVLRGNAVNYLVLQACPPLKVGSLGVNHPARPNEDIRRLREKGVKVFALADDLTERGISEGNCISGAQIIRRTDVAGLMDDYEQVWHW